jgi:hypothetical protein
MKSRDLIDKLSKVSPDAEVIGGTWNGRVDTYTVLDSFHKAAYDDIYPDYFGTPGAFDDRLSQIRSKDVVYLGSTITTTCKSSIPVVSSGASLPFSGNTVPLSGRKAGYMNS